jgi:hypothetical protein
VNDFRVSRLSWSAATPRHQSELAGNQLIPFIEFLGWSGSAASEEFVVVRSGRYAYLILFNLRKAAIEKRAQGTARRLSHDSMQLGWF